MTAIRNDLVHWRTSSQPRILQGAFATAELLQVDVMALKASDVYCALLRTVVGSLTGRCDIPIALGHLLWEGRQPVLACWIFLSEMGFTIAGCNFDCGSESWGYAGKLTGRKSTFVHDLHS